MYVYPTWDLLCFFSVRITYFFNSGNFSGFLKCNFLPHFILYFYFNFYLFFNWRLISLMYTVSSVHQGDSIMHIFFILSSLEIPVVCISELLIYHPGYSDSLSHFSSVYLYFVFWVVTLNPFKFPNFPPHLFLVSSSTYPLNYLVWWC